MKTTKESFLVGKDYVKVKKDTFDSMNNVIKESKKVMEMQAKLQTIFNEVDIKNLENSLEKCSSSGSSVPRAYAVGDVINFAGSDWRVIKNSTEEDDYVTVLKVWY